MDQKRWKRWVMQTATRWEDLKDIIPDTGIERIDQDHRRLIEYILDMGDIANIVEGENYDSEQLQKQTMVFNRFLGAIGQHYDTEEYFMDRYGLPGKEHQINQHDSIFKKFNRIFSDFNEGLLSTFQNMKIDFIEELINHMNQVDAQTFSLDNFVPTMEKAEKWEDVSEIIKTTGVPFVDDEHRDLTVKIIELKAFLSKISHKIKTKSQKETLLSLIEGLYQFTVLHFKHEVQFLDKYHLSTEKQETQHDIFLRAVSEQKNKILKNLFDDLDKFIAFLFSWWVNHINGIDYVEFHFSRIAEPVFKQSESADDFSWMIRKTGIDQIDQEHSHLIGLLLELGSTDFQKEKSLDIKGELNKVYEFAGLHFTHEEKIMKDKKFKGIDIHQDIHARLAQNVHDAVTHAVSGRSQLSPLFYKRLMNLWVGHTNGMDYETFVLNKTLM